MKNVVLSFFLVTFCMVFSPTAAKADHGSSFNFGTSYRNYDSNYGYNYNYNYGYNYNYNYNYYGNHSGYNYGYRYSYRPYCGIGQVSRHCVAPGRKFARFLGRSGFFAARAVYYPNRFAVRGVIRTATGVARFAMFGRRFR